MSRTQTPRVCDTRETPSEAKRRACQCAPLHYSSNHSNSVDQLSRTRRVGVSISSSKARVIPGWSLERTSHGPSLSLVDLFCRVESPRGGCLLSCPLKGNGRLIYFGVSVTLSPQRGSQAGTKFSASPRRAYVKGITWPMLMTRRLDLSSQGPVRGEVLAFGVVLAHLMMAHWRLTLSLAPGVGLGPVPNSRRLMLRA